MTRVLLSEEEIGAALDALRSGWLTMGPRIGAFEQALAAHVGVAHAVAVASESAALHLALLALGLGAGDELLLDALAPVELRGAAARAGVALRPAAGHDPSAPGLDAAAVTEIASASTNAVVVSHLAGVPAAAADLRGLCEERGWRLVEDATHAVGGRLGDGRPVGGAGHVACVGLRAGGLLGVGEGAVVLTDDEAVAARARSLRSHAMTTVTWDRHRGHADTYDVVDIGYNARLDEPRAALAHARLARLEERASARRAAAARLREAGEAAGLRPVWTADRLERAAPQAVGLLGGEPARAAATARLAAVGVAAERWPTPLGPLASATAAHADTLLIDLAAAEAAGVEEVAAALVG